MTGASRLGRFRGVRLHGARPRADQWWWPWVGLALLACMPAAWHLLDALRTGWWPVNDDALTALSARDVTTGHAPVMGPRTTTRNETGIETHHPGPALYYLLALPSALGGHRPGALLLGTLLLSVVLVATAVLVARRVGGPAAAVTMALVALALQWAVGGGLMLRPFNPYPSVVAVLPLFALAWSVVRGRLTSVPGFLVVASLCVQGHLSYGIALLPLVLGVVVVGLLGWYRSRGVVWPLRGWRRVGAPSHRRLWAVAVGLTAVVWLPPIVELVRFRPNNLTQLLRYLGSERGDSLGVPLAAKLMARFAAPVPGGMEGVPAVGAFAPDVSARAAGWPQVVVGGALVLLLVALAVGPVLSGPVLRACAGNARVHDVVQTLLPRPSEVDGARVALLLWVGATLVVASVPLGAGGATWNFLQAWAATFLLWGVVGLCAVRRVARLVPAPRPVAARGLVGLGAVLVALGLAAAVTSAPRVPWGSGNGVRAAMPMIVDGLDAVAPRRGSERRHVVITGDSLGASYSIAPGIAVGLDETDDVHLGAVWEAPEDTDFRKLVSAPEGSPEVFVGTEGGQDEVPPPEGARPVCVLDGPDGGRFVVFVVPPAR